MLAQRLREKSEENRRWRYDVILGEIQRQDGDLDRAEATLMQAIYDQARYGGLDVFLWQAVRSLRDLVKTRLENDENPDEMMCVKSAEKTVESGTLTELRGGLWVCTVLVWNEEYQTSERLARKYVERRERENPVRPENHATAHALLGASLMKQGRFDEALPYLQKAQRLASNYAPPSHWSFHAIGLVGDCLLGLKRFAEAEKCILEGFHGCYQNYSANLEDNYDQILATRVDGCVQLYRLWNQAEPSDELEQKLEFWQGEKKRIEEMLEPNQELISVRRH